MNAQIDKLAEEIIIEVFAFKNLSLHSPHANEQTDTQKCKEAVVEILSSHVGELIEALEAQLDEAKKALQEIRQLTSSGSGDKVVCLVIIQEANRIAAQSLAKEFVEGDSPKEEK